MADVDGRRLVGAAVLVEEAELGGDGATEREQDAESHELVKKAVVVLPQFRGWS